MLEINGRAQPISNQLISYTASCWPSGKGIGECESESFSSIILYLFSCLGIYCQCLTRAHAESTCFENIFENLASILQ